MRSNIIFLCWGMLVHFLFRDHRNETFFLEHLSKCNFREKSLDWLRFESVAANHWKESLTHDFASHKDHMMSICYFSELPL